MRPSWRSAIGRSAPAWCRSAAMPCRSSTRPASSPSTTGRATHAGLFDVSHMGPCFLSLNAPSGDADADHAAIAAVIEPLICGDIAGLKPGQIRYTLLLNEAGGVIDDLMVARRRARRRARSTSSSMPAPRTAISTSSARPPATAPTLTRADEDALLALQGPEAAAVMGSLVPAATDLGFMTYRRLRMAGRAHVRLALRLHRRGRFRNPRPAGEWRKALGRAPCRRAGQAGRPRRPRFATPRSRPAAQRPRPRCDHLAGRGRSRLRRLQAPPRARRFSRRPAHPRANWTRARRAAASASGRTARRPPARAPRSATATAGPSAWSPPAASARPSEGRSPWAMSPPVRPSPRRRSISSCAARKSPRPSCRCLSFPTAITANPNRSVLTR